MSTIRERTGLCVVELPKKLTSRRNLLAYFSKFGDVKNVVVNKELRTGLINFSSHFHAQAAKTQGTVFEGSPLKIFWSEASHDPRARNKQEYSALDASPLWQDDEKECFGVETLQPTVKKEKKPISTILIKQHLKLDNVKKRVAPIQISEEPKEEEGAAIKSPKPKKVGIKFTARELKFGKKNLALDKKRKILKEKILTASCTNMKQTLNSPESDSNLTPTPILEHTDLQHKLSLLDERDKSIRKETITDSDIKTALAIKGTCKDMCPERERLSRQCGHAIAYYEMIPGTNSMDENKAVKEYTRSSADQEVPLPHDLRPEPVLTMTMNYMITNIISRVDDPDENKAVWYSFCWNRLRSVRKDIILQQLCDLEAVKIIEQCARFHICCYDHMCGADISGFDDKINTQILNDCLQTLRQMYEDLCQRNIYCPNKAEFYSYIILLKLKSDDIIWEYQKYSSEIQLSSQVQFAVEVYMAVKNNMYSKYFHLVKMAPYLTACLMQRYFYQVRTKAIKVMVKAYGLPSKAVGLSSSFVMSSLKFDSHKNALKFCESEGVNLRFDGVEDETDVFVSSSSFLIKEKRLPIANAVVGENNPLPVYVPHQVHTSFDEFGNLKTLSTIVDTNEVKENDNEDSASILSEEMSFIEEKSEAAVQKSENVPQDSFKFTLSPTKVKEPFFGKAISSFKFVSEEKPVFQLNDQNKFTFGLINEDVTKMEQESDEIGLQDSKINYNCKNVLSSETPFMFNNLQNSSIQNDTQKPFSFSLNSPSYKSSLGLKYEDLKSLSTENQTPKLKDNANMFSFEPPKSQLVHSFPSTGNIEYLSSKSVGHTGLNTHITKDESIWSKQNESLLEKGSESLNVIKEQKSNLIEKNQLDKLVEIDKSKEFEYLMSMKKAEEEKLRLEEERRAEMVKMQRKIEDQKILNNLRKYVGKRLKAINAKKCARQWKNRIEHLKKTRADFPMLVQLSVKKHIQLWGTVDSLPFNSIFKRVREQRNSINIISHLLLTGITESCKYIGSLVAEELAKSAAQRMKKGVVKPVYWKLAISVPWCNNTSSELSVFNQLMRKWCTQAFYKNLNASLGSVESLTTSLQIPVNLSVDINDDFESVHDLQSFDALIFIVLNDSESEKECLQRMRTLVTCQGKHSDFAVAVMNIGLCKQERVLKMELEELHEQNIVQNWKVSNWSSPNSILESLNFLTKHVNVAYHICTTSLKLLVEKVTEEFFDSLSSGQHWCKGLKAAIKNPNNVISLYNTCLTKLEDILMSSKLEKYFGFAEEFKMCVPLDESGGPELMCGKQYNGTYKSHISKKINSLKLPEFPKWPPTSVNHLAKILRAYCSEIHDACIFPQIIRMIDLPDDVDVRQHVELVCWLNIVEIWAQCNIKHTFSFRDKSKQLFVMYNESDVDRMLKKQWWIKLPMVSQFNK